MGKVVDELSLDKDSRIKGPLKKEKAVNRTKKEKHCKGSVPTL